MKEIEDDTAGPVEVMPVESYLAGSESPQVTVDRGKPESVSTAPSSAAAVSCIDTKKDNRSAMFLRKERREKAQHETLQKEVARTRPYRKPYHKYHKYIDGAGWFL